MAKTLRRKHGNQGWKHWLLSERRAKYEYPGIPVEEARKKLIARYHADGQWTMTTPSAWIREMMTRPQRAQTRALLTKVMRLEDLEEAPLFPLSKKPHRYYW